MNHRKEKQVKNGTILEKRANSQRLNDLGTAYFIKTRMMIKMIK